MLKASVILLAAAVLAGVIILSVAQDARGQEPRPAPARAHDAGTSGMAHGAVLVSILMMIALPSVVLLLVTRVAGVGIEQPGLLRCVWTSLLFLCVAALIFYKAQGVENALNNPVEFYNQTGLLVRLGIALVAAFLIQMFLLSGTPFRSFLGAVLYLVGVYGCAYLAWALLVASGAQGMLGGVPK